MKAHLSLVGPAGRSLLCGIMALLTLSAFGIRPANAEGRVVTVGLYENAPKVFIADSGEPAGIFVDIIEHIAAAEDWDLRYVTGTWGEGLDRLERGDLDLMPDVAHTSDRERVFAFHKVPVLSSWFQVYARRGSGIDSILDLAEKRVVVLERSVQQDAFARLADGFGLNATLIALPDYHALFEWVARGDADAAVTNRFYGLMHARKFGLEDTAIVFHPTNLFFAAPATASRTLLDVIDGHLARLKEDPGSVYYESLKRWTSEEVSFTLPAWVKIAGIVVAAALIMSLAGGMVLRRQVNARTSELRQINREMETRIEERTAKLATAMEKARAADHLKSAFLATMSHELRTPLNSIIGFTGIMLQGLAGPLNEEQHKQMHMVQNSSRHLLALINDVLDISKIEAGELSLSFTSFDLRASIEKTVEMVLPQAKKRGIQVMREIGGDVATVSSDQRRLEQVILNLLTNAVKFTEQGHVRIVCRSDNDQYVLSVADTGVGIREEDIPGLFQPFHQVDTGLSRRHEGTGLGLSICRKLIVMLGGAIDVESRWGRGSTFAIRFPKGSGEAS